MRRGKIVLLRAVVCGGVAVLPCHFSMHHVPMDFFKTMVLWFTKRDTDRWSNIVVHAHPTDVLTWLNACLFFNAECNPTPKCHRSLHVGQQTMASAVRQDCVGQMCVLGQQGFDFDYFFRGFFTVFHRWYKRKVVHLCMGQQRIENFVLVGQPLPTFHLVQGRDGVVEHGTLGLQRWHGGYDGFQMPKGRQIFFKLQYRVVSFLHVDVQAANRVIHNGGDTF